MSWFGNLFKPAASSPASRPDTAPAPAAAPASASTTTGSGGATSGTAGGGNASARATASPRVAAGSPDTSALNPRIVQAVQFSNAQTAQYLPELIQAPPDAMATQTAGLAVQSAAHYMNAIMQIALAAQAVVAKKASEGPAEAAMEIPVMLEMQKMVSSAVEIYGTVSQTAGNSAKTIVGDLPPT